MSVPNDNDAGRLYNILEKLKSFPSNSPYDAFAEVFDIKDGNKFTVHEYFLDLLMLAKNVKAMIGRLNTKKDIFYYTIDFTASTICLINFIDKENGLREFKKALSESVLAGMEFTSLFMSDKFGEKKLEESNLDGLHNEVIALMEEIESSSVDDELKVNLTSNLKNINTAISKYNIFGANGLKEAFERAIGSYVLATSEKSVDSESDRAFLKKVYYTICGFSNIVSSPQTVYLIAPPVILGASDEINNVGKVIKNII